MRKHSHGQIARQLLEEIVQLHRRSGIRRLQIPFLPRGSGIRGMQVPVCLPAPRN
jgi:hypothetical protein